MNLEFLSMRHLPRTLQMIGLGFAGLCVGGGAYLATISEAASYLSDEPEACINCHIMVPQYSTWQHSSHGRVTTCNDCHVPQDSTWRKYWFKANDGLRHSALFTLRMERQVIEAIPESKEVIQKNCIRCHESVVSQAMTPIGHDFERPCVECHREVPHGRVHSLSSTPNAAVPPPTNVFPELLRRANATDKDQNR
jgi:cytochrome c nitrite reductase small subunit